MNTRRNFIRQTSLGALALGLSNEFIFANARTIDAKDLKISLAQWSLNKAFFGGDLDAEDFASIAKNTFDIDAIEYVNSFYKENATDENFWSMMRMKAEDSGVKSLLIMVDETEKLGDLNTTKRTKAVKDHYKWIHAAKILGCHSIRVNAFGDGSPDELETSLVDGLGMLTEYAAKEKINVLLENHGLHTSNASFMAGIIKQVDNPFLGTLPDFGNWCLNAEWGGTSESQNCTNMYPPDEGLKEWLPFAKGVSAKAYEFDAAGNDTVVDFPKLLKIVKESNFDGHIGIEYEGDRMGEIEGIKATKKLIEAVWKTV
jgi:sugar phosphate isomerase/epimerase